MEEALKNLFLLFQNELMTPLNNAIKSSQIFNYLIEALNNLGNSFFKMFNNSNTFVVNAEHIASVITIVVLILILSAVINVFKILIETVRDALSGSSGYEWRSNWKRRRRK